MVPLNSNLIFEIKNIYNYILLSFYTHSVSVYHFQPTFTNLKPIIKVFKCVMCSDKYLVAVADYVASDTFDDLNVAYRLYLSVLAKHIPYNSKLYFPYFQFDITFYQLHYKQCYLLCSGILQKIRDKDQTLLSLLSIKLYCLPLAYKTYYYLSVKTHFEGDFL